VKSVKFLVTGGAGFIGSHLVDRFMVGGYGVTVIDCLSSGSVENVERWLNDPRFRFVKEDLKGPGGWMEEFRGYRRGLPLRRQPGGQIERYGA
jgi:UDP-glucose 4-epimerase